MASRIDYSQNRKLYVGTTAEISVADGNAIIAGNVGIGTTSPAYKLHTKGTANGNVNIAVENDSTGTNAYSSYRFKNDSIDTAVMFLNGSNNTGYAGASSLNMYQGTSLPLGFVTNNLLRMIVAGDGNVGIGTTSPSEKLDINGRVRIGDINYSYGGSNYHILLAENSNDAYISNINGYGILSAGGYYHGSNLRKLNSTSTAYSGIQTRPDGTIHFESATGGTAGSTIAASTKMYISGAGNVGIGTTSPGQKLSVAPSTDVSGEFGYTHVGNVGYNGYAGFSHVNLNSQGNYALLQQSNGTTFLNASTGQSVRFRINNSDKMILDSSGNFGIGTTSPSQKLHVSGNARVTGAYYDSNNSPGTSGQVLSSTGTGTDWVDAGGGGGGISGTIANTQVAYGTGTDTIGGHSGLTYDGFGTLTVTQIQCTSNLFVASSIYHYGDTNTRIAFGGDQIDLYAGGLKMITADEGATDEVIINQDSNDINFRVESNANAHMFFVDGGLNRVGINQSVPSYTLDVNGDAKISGTIVDSTNSAGNNNDVLTSTGSGWSWQPASGGGGGIGGSIANTQVAFGNSSSEITGDADFNFDVSTNTLRVGVDQDYNGGIIAMAMTADDLYSNFDLFLGQYVYHKGDTSAFFGFPANDTFIINTSFNESVRVNSSNNVGIGTGSVIQSKLDVKTTSTSQNVLRVEMPGSSSFQTGLIIQSSSASATVQKFIQGISTRGSITFAGLGGVAYNTSSDYRIKENIIAITDGIERVKQLKPSRFNFIGGEQIVDGFIAHEVQGVIPEAIHGEKDETEEYEISPEVLDEEGNVLEEAVIGTKDKLQGIDQSKIVPLLTAALQEAITKIETLETRIQTLENK